MQFTVSRSAVKRHFAMANETSFYVCVESANCWSPWNSTTKRFGCCPILTGTIAIDATVILVLVVEMILLFVLRQSRSQSCCRFAVRTVVLELLVCSFTLCVFLVSHLPLFLNSLIGTFSSWTLQIVETIVSFSMWLIMLIRMALSLRKRRSPSAIVSVCLLLHVVLQSLLFYNGLSNLSNISVQTFLTLEVVTILLKLFLVAVLTSSNFAFAVCHRHVESALAFGAADDRQPLIHIQSQQRTITLSSESQSNCFSRLTFWWARRLMVKGYRRELQDCDSIYDLPYDIKPQFTQEHLRGRLIRRRVLHERTSLVKKLHLTYGIRYYVLGILKFIGDILSFGGPALLHELVEFVGDQSKPLKYGFIYAGVIFLCAFFSSLFGIHFNYQVNLVSLKVRSLVVSEVYDLLSKLRASQLSHSSTGQITNLMSTDIDRLVGYCVSFHTLWSIPLQICVSFYLLYREVGLVFLAGVGFALLLIPFNRWLAKRICKYSTDMMSYKDKRIDLITEMLFGVRVIKFCSLEKIMTGKIASLRKEELRNLKGMKYLDALCVYLWAALPVVISILTFSIYVLLGNRLTAAKVFTSIAVFNMLIGPLNALPWVINGVVESWISAKRLQGFFDLGEVPIVNRSGSTESLNESIYSTRKDLHLRGDSFRWSSDDAKPVLHGIDLSIPRGKLVGIVGRVGAGKSSLLQALLGELHCTDQTVHDLLNSLKDVSIGYCSQEPWLEQGTVRENVLFGCVYVKDRYDRVLAGCALDRDIEQMPQRDLTVVGEQGVSLSGGQRVRLALARAVYQNFEIYLLDDPLSALDPIVASHVFQNCIKSLLHDKTVLLVTHSVQFLRSADYVIHVDNGRVVDFGKPESVIQSLLSSPAVLPAGTEESNAEQQQTLGGDEPFHVQEEEKYDGTVALSVYRDYLAAVGRCLCFLIFLSFFFMQSSRNLSDWWLSFWITKDSQSGNGTMAMHASLVNNIAWFRHSFTQLYASPILLSNYESNSTKINKNMYLGIYFGIAGSNTVFTLIRAFLFAYGGIVAAYAVHDRFLSAILRGQVRFFDATPIGRLVNRFSSDTYAVDSSVPFESNCLLANIFSLTGLIIIVCYALPWFCVALPPLGLVYYIVQRYYRFTSCELKRISSISLSPLYSHFSSSIKGFVTVRAFKSVQRFKDLNKKYLEGNLRANYSVLVCGQWLSVHLQFLGVLTVTCVALIAVVQHKYHSVNPGLVGLAMSYALAITNLLNWCVTAFTETEKQLVSMERIAHYIKNIPSEKWTGSVNLLGSWPKRGTIQFHNACLRYRPELPFALNQLCLTIRGGEHVGVVGRTGSGKSSIFQALFRAFELERGSILIDGVNIAQVDLERLRCCLAIVPQVPCLFSGSIRENLDVLERNTQDEIQRAVTACGLEAVVTRLGGLDAPLSGSQLSVGERQLFCLARAILCRARVICIDEATAHVDVQTERSIQRAVANLIDVTVLTIAHRTDTVRDCDRILVMNQGSVAEFDTPTALLANPNSVFTRMCCETNN